MSFIKRFMKNKNNDIKSDNEMNESEAKRKFERKLVLAQSDPEPVIDLSSCQLNSIGVNILSTIRIYNKTLCRFDHNLLTQFGCESLHSLQSIKSLHLAFNQINTLGQFVSDMIHLKELYLSHNQLSSLPSSFSELKELKILSLRDNKFITFPNVIIGCSSLSCIDMGENQLTELPKSLIKLKLLKSLQLDGNPMSVPSREICDKGVEYIIPELEKLCSNSDDEYDNNTNNTNSDIQTGSHYDEKYDSEDSDDNKDQKKRDLLEWERSFQSNQFISDNPKELNKKKEILSNLWKEQRLLSANISSIRSRKDKDKETILNSIVQLEKHSEQLIESINNWEEKQKQQLEMLEDAENANLEMMLRYDHKVNLKKNAIFVAMQEMLRLESQRFALSDELKEFNHLELTTKLNQKEQLQREAFEVLQRTRDYRNQLITNQILLIENELTNLTQVEMQRKDDKLDSILNDIRIQRAKLAFLLSRLLTEKKERELHLREQLRKMEQRRNQIQDENFWLVQYQYLLEQQPIETQIQQFAIEGRVAIVLLAVHKDNERIVKYLPLFTQITFDRLNSMGDKELLNFGIDDYELCKVIRDKIDEQCSDTASALPQTPRPSAPTQLQLPVIEEQSTSSATIVYEQNESFCDIKLWCQTECVICFDQSCNIVFLPCGHVCTCDKCCALITLCPLCRVDIEIQQCLTVRYQL